MIMCKKSTLSRLGVDNRPKRLWRWCRARLIEAASHHNPKTKTQLQVLRHAVDHLGILDAATIAQFKKNQE